MSLRIKSVVDKFVQELKEALEADIQDRIMKEREMQSYIEEREREVAEREAAWKAELSRREVIFLALFLSFKFVLLDQVFRFTQLYMVFNLVFLLLIWGNLCDFMLCFNDSYVNRLIIGLDFIYFLRLNLVVTLLLPEVSN